MDGNAALLDTLADRVRCAANPHTPMVELERLCHDPDATVRAAVALNPASGAAGFPLARDADERVRAVLARKVAGLLPALAQADPDRLRDRAHATLSLLVRDEAVRVRASLAQVAATLTDLPREVLLELAHDTAIPVSEPVLRLSPLLSADDMLALLQSPPHEEASVAIARRADLPGSVADAIAASADTGAIRAMLANPSAAIRERTLDMLIARAAHEPTWHEPLVHRPTLPDHAARALSEIVCTELLRVLAARPDLSDATLAELQRTLRQVARTPAAAPRAAPSSDDTLVEEMRRLEAASALDETTLIDALRRMDRRRATAVLAVGSGVAVAAVDRAAHLRSAKSLVSLVWKAGFSMRAAAPVQTLLGELAPANLLAAAPGGGFPLTPDEMSWQIDFLVSRRS